MDIDVAIPNASNTRKKGHKKLEKYRGLKQEPEKMWKVKATVVSVIIGLLRALTPKLGAWLQKNLGTTERQRSPIDRSPRNS